MITPLPFPRAVKSAFSRTASALYVVLVLCLLTTQGFAAMHATEHALGHSSDHCSICLVADQMSSTALAVPPVIIVSAYFKETSYIFRVSLSSSFDFFTGYSARAPPIL